MARDKHMDMVRLIKSTRDQNEIPVTFDGDIPEFAFNKELQEKRLLIGNKSAVTLREKDLEQPKSYYSALFRDPVFFRRYVKELERLSEHDYLDKLFRELNQDIRTALAILYKDRPDYQFRTGVYYRNQEYIRAALDPAKAIHAYWHGADDGIARIQIGNLQAFPIEIVRLITEESESIILR